MRTGLFLITFAAIAVLLIPARYESIQDNDEGLLKKVKTLTEQIAELKKALASVREEHETTKGKVTQAQEDIKGIAHNTRFIRWENANSFILQPPGGSYTVFFVDGSIVQFDKTGHNGRVIIGAR